MKEADVYDAEEKLRTNVSTSTGHQRLLVGGCSMLVTSCTCSAIRKLDTPKLGRFSSLILILIFVAGISHGTNPPSKLTLVLIIILVADISHGSNPPSNMIFVLILILVADISHGSNPPSNLILAYILVAGSSHGSNPPSKLILNFIMILIWNLIYNLSLNLILVLILLAGLSHHTRASAAYYT